MELWQPLYIIRGGQFGVDFTPKIVWIAIGIVLVLWDRRARRSWDALWVFLAGTLLVGGMEGYLQATGNRIMPERSLFGQPLPFALSLPLQAVAEGGTISVLALFIGDRLRRPDSRGLGWWLLGIACAGILLREWRALATLDAIAVYSRRSLLSPGSLLFLPAVVLWNGVFFLRHPSQRARLAGMAGVLLLLAGLWTLAQSLIGVRWIETAGPSPDSYVRADLPTTFAALTFSIVVEVTLVLVLPYTLPAALGLIRPDP